MSGFTKAFFLHIVNNNFLAISFSIDHVRPHVQFLLYQGDPELAIGQCRCGVKRSGLETQGYRFMSGLDPHAVNQNSLCLPSAMEGQPFKINQEEAKKWQKYHLNGISSVLHQILKEIVFKKDQPGKKCIYLRERNVLLTLFGTFPHGQSCLLKCV